MSDYASDVLVSADWVAERLDEFQSDDPAHRLVEVDVDTEAYDESHAPGAIGFNWETDLQDQTRRDVLSKEDFEALNAEHGVSDDSTVVLYGDNSNWFAAYTYWQYKYYGHDDVRLLDGGREYWLENDYEVTDEVPSFPETEYEADEPDESIRAYRGDVEDAIDQGVPLVDVRSPEEFSGEILAPPGLQETAQRGGHIPGARNISWASVTNDDGTFKTKEELEELYADVLAEGDEEIVAYCRILGRLVRAPRARGRRPVCQLRRLLDGVGEPRARTHRDRPRRRLSRPVSPTTASLSIRGDGATARPSSFAVSRGRSPLRQSRLCRRSVSSPSGSRSRPGS